MANRLDLQRELEELLETSHVYFQPSENVKLKYPCFIFNLNGSDTQYANNKPYVNVRRYQLMYVTKNPDDELIDKIVNSFRMIRFDRWFASDGLNHYVYNLYY